MAVSIKSVFKSPKTFLVDDSLVHSSKVIYDHAYEVWDDQFGDWSKFQDLLESQCQGSAKEAQQIANYLTLFKQLATAKGNGKNLGYHIGQHTLKNATSAEHESAINLQNQLEIEMFNNFMDDPRANAFFTNLEGISKWKDKNDRKHQGDILENFVENVVVAALQAIGYKGPIGQITTGGEMAQSRTIHSTIMLDASSPQEIFKDDSKKLNEDTRALVADAIGIAKEEIQNQMEYTVTHLGGQSYIVEARIEASKTQKADSMMNVYISANSNGFFEDFIKLVQGKTFSEKNYAFGSIDEGEGKGNSRRIHFGDTAWYRKYSSFFFAGSTGKISAANRADMGTFIFSTYQAVVDEHEPPNSDYRILTNYQKWVDTFYEVMGIGQRSDMRLVDYIIVNNANSPRDVVTVVSMKDVLSNLPSNWYQQSPPFALDRSGRVTLMREIGGHHFYFKGRD